MAGLAANRSDAECRVCGWRTTRFLCRTPNEHSRTRWLDSFRCLECGSVFIANVISNEELSEAYGTIDAAAYYRETATSSARKFHAAAGDLAGLLEPSAAILDIGGGDGAFVRALHARGFRNLSLHELPGHDLPDLTGVVRGVYRDIGYSTVADASFDAVTMMDVMEHVADPRATIAEVRRMLRPGGLLYLHTPVVTLLDRAMHGLQRLPLVGGVGRAWQRARTSIFHLQNYTPRSLRGLMARRGFEVVRLACVNELSWPLPRYVRVYLIEKQGVPEALGPLLVWLSRPLVRSRLHANKAVLVARSRI